MVKSGNRLPIIISAHSLDKKLKDVKITLNGLVEDCFGTYMEENDESDISTLPLKETIRHINKEYDRIYAKKGHGFFIRLARKFPLLPLISVADEVMLLLAQVDEVQKETEVTTRKRSKYKNVSKYAFQPEDDFRSFWPTSARCISWEVHLELLATSDSKRTWQKILGFSQKDLEKWWKARHVPSNLPQTDGWPDFKALCKSVVYILDDTSEFSTDSSLAQFETFERLSKIADKAKDISVELVFLYSGHPDQSHGISKLFGLTVPIFYSLSKIVERAKKAYEQDSAVQNLASESLSSAVSEVDRLVMQMLELIRGFAALVMADVYMSSEEQGTEYTQKPSLRQLFSPVTETVSDKAKLLMLESGIFTNTSEISKASTQILKSEASKAVDIVLRHSSCSRVDYIKELQDFGLERKYVHPTPLKILGSGSFALVRAHQSQDGSEKYAIKSSLRAQGAWSRVRKEASVWARLNHENVLKLLGYCLLGEDEAPALVSPVACSSVEVFFTEAEVNVTERTRLQLLRDAARGVNYLHSEGVAHGDLRAANILVQNIEGGEKRAVLCDFGFARWMNANEDAYDSVSIQQTADGWLAPELLCAPKEVTVRVTFEGDIFAFGCVILEIMSKMKPFARYDASEIRSVRQDGILPAKQEDMGDRYWPIAKRCWNVLPDERPRAEFVLHALSDILENSHVS